MAFNSKTAKDVFYQYFWIKIASAEHVNTQRKLQLLNGPDGNGFWSYKPCEIVPGVRGKPAALKLLNRRANVHVGFQNMSAAAVNAGSAIDIRPLKLGADIDQARAWTSEGEGKAWAAGAVCVLCFTAVQLGPSKAKGKPAQKRTKKKAAARKKVARKRAK